MGCTQSFLHWAGTLCDCLQRELDATPSHFFFPPLSPSSLRSHEITLPNITTPLPSMKATREGPSQFLKLSQTKGCWGWKLTCAISFDLRNGGPPSSCRQSPCPFSTSRWRRGMRRGRNARNQSGDSLSRSHSGCPKPESAHRTHESGPR